jgi:hypothetical protein
MNGALEIGARVGLVVVALGGWFWTQRLLAVRPAVGGRIGDRLHEWSAPLHGWLTVHPRATDLTLIVTSALIDLCGGYLLVSAVFGPTVRPLLAVLLVFALRQVCQALCALPTPPGCLWRDPGFPSLLVTYGTSSDFFFSGHTAISVLAALQLIHVAPPALAAVGIAVAILEAAAVIVLRAHYTMDVFAAVFAAWAAEVVAGRLAPWVDAWLGRLS